MNTLGEQFGDVLTKVQVKPTRPVPVESTGERIAPEPQVGFVEGINRFNTASYLKEELDTTKLRLAEAHERIAHLEAELARREG